MWTTSIKSLRHVAIMTENLKHIRESHSYSPNIYVSFELFSVLVSIIVFVIYGQKLNLTLTAASALSSVGINNFFAPSGLIGSTVTELDGFVF
jgi:hypothetical protein